MIFAGRQSDLHHSINRMTVPVFVADQDEDGAFWLVALNAAFAKATGLSPEAAIGRTPHAILPESADADFLVEQCRTCVARLKPISYSTNITFSRERQMVETVLHPVSLNGGAPRRLVGQVTVSKPWAKKGGDACDCNGRLAKADAQSIEAVLDDIRRRRPIRSNDLMILSTLMSHCNLSPAEVARMVERGENGRMGVSGKLPAHAR